MLVDVAVVPQQAQSGQNAVCIVVDVLRASSMIVTLLEQGVSLVLPVSSVSQARRLARKYGYLLGGERDGLAQPGFDFGNSPAELISRDLRNRGVVFTTSNGTAVLNHLINAKTILVGCILNAAACCEHALLLAQQHDTRLAIVCAGQNGYFALDDGVCAGFLVDIIAGLAAGGCQLSDAALAMRKLYRSYDDVLTAFRESISGKRITEIGQEADLALCARPNVSRIVPIVTRADHLQIEQL